MARRSQSAPHMHVLVCICSNARLVPWTSLPPKTRAQYKSSNHLTGTLWKRKAVTPNWGFWGNLGSAVRTSLARATQLLCYNLYPVVFFLPALTVSTVVRFSWYTTVCFFFGGGGGGTPI